MKSIFGAACLLSACGSIDYGTRPEPVAAVGKADQFSVPQSSGDVRASDLPPGAALSEVRIGNDSCYYVVKDGVPMLLKIGGDPGINLCLERLR